ncbi:GNAT family N-acetyltransferase [Serpentinicella alkaliphila]|nr:GNAT family N-acetyltransferase [Serpentinicella alkaliphila]QUH26521.1 GNAT family N-acetyltransferase [Serpentinicella alkaliphila]
MSYNMICGLVNGDNRELTNFGLKCGEEWPRPDTYDIMKFLSISMKKKQEPSGYEIWLIAKKDGKVVIGNAGFTGPPDADGRIEIGYGIVYSERNKRYGYESAKALIDWAKAQNNVKKICASGVLVDNYASIRILNKVGMEEISRDENGIYFEMIAGHVIGLEL